MIARLDATVAFLADALDAFGDRDPEDLRRVKAVALLANPVRAVELLAAFAALRSPHPRRARSTSTGDPPTTSPTLDRHGDRPARLRPAGEPDALGADGRVRAAGRVQPHAGCRTG